MPERQAAKIRRRIEKFAENPRRRDIDVRKLKGRSGFRLRVDPWRIIFDVQGDEVDVMIIAHRKDAYRK